MEIACALHNFRIRHVPWKPAPKLYDTPHRSPQPHLWELGEAEWLLVVQVPEYAPRKRRQISGTQGQFFA